MPKSPVKGLLQSCHTPFTHSASPCYKVVTLHSHTLPVLVTKLSHSIHILCQSSLQRCNTPFTHSASPGYKVLVTELFLQTHTASPGYKVLVTTLQHSIHTLCQSSLQSPCYRAVTLHSHTLQTHTLPVLAALYFHSPHGVR